MTFFAKVAVSLHFRYSSHLLIYAAVVIDADADAHANDDADANAYAADAVRAHYDPWMYKHNL